MIDIWTDGSSRGNPGPGGYGLVAATNHKIIYTYSKQESNITNNQAELKAILYAFELTESIFQDQECIIHSDSSYVVNICNDWIFKWVRNNWMNSKNKQIENLFLIQCLYKYINKDFSNCQVVYCKSHCGIVENELADALATNNLNRFNKIIQEKDIEVEIVNKI